MPVVARLRSRFGVRRACVVADRGLTPHVEAGHWQDIVATMREAFRQRRFEQGLMQAVAAVEAPLLRHFPLRAGERNPNELPDRPHLAGST